MKIQSKTIYHLPFTINEASPRRRVVLNLGHLYFDIVSTVRCPVEDFVLRISYFASLHILMPANPKSEDVRILTYEIINLFMQNEPNFRKSQMNVNKVLAMDYEQMDTWSIRKTKPIKANSKPIQSQSKPIKANKMPKQTQSKPICRGVASGEAGKNPISKAKKCCSPPLCCGIFKEKMIFCNLINRKYQID